MNIERQYKFYKLGIEVPPSLLNAFKFLEEIISKLKPIKNIEHTSTIFYVDDTNTVYMEYKIRSNIFYCRKDCFWDVVEKESFFTYTEIQCIMTVVFEKYFKLVDIRPTRAMLDGIYDRWYIVSNSMKQL